MSMRSELIQESDTFKYAFLASQTAAILKKDGEASITIDEENKLQNALTFVDNLISGAENLTPGNAHSFASYDAIKALSFVLDPIESLRAFVKEEKIAAGDGSQLLTMFKRISAYLSLALEQKRVIGVEDKTLTTEFFHWLSQTLLETVKQLPSASLPQHSKTMYH